MGVVIIPFALLAGVLLGYPSEVIVAGTACAYVAQFVWETIRDFLEAVL